MVLGFSGWMDGGDASTGTVEYLIGKLGAEVFAEIEPSEFYLYNFPGPMEVAALFRPHTKIAEGKIVDFQEPTSRFYYDSDTDLILFVGKEPNFRWKEYAACVLGVATQFNVRQLFFVGSVASTVPHTREPRFLCSVSRGRLRGLLQKYGVQPSDYEGPASFVTYLIVQARQRGLEMTSLVAEIPAYVQGRNVRSIEAVSRKLLAVLGVSIDLDELRAQSLEFAKRLDEVVRGRPELAELIRKIEKDYDKEVLDSQMAELKAWFEKQDIRLD